MKGTGTIAKLAVVTSILVVALFAGGPAAEAKMGETTKDRGKIDATYTWNIQDLYPTLQDWEQELLELEGRIEQFVGFRGSLANSVSHLADCLDARFVLLRQFHKLASYAARVYHQDMRISDSQGLHDRIGKIGTKAEAVLAFVEPELLAIPAEKLEEFLKSKRLQVYRQYLHNVTRRREHIRSPEIEAVVAQTGDMAAGATKVYQTLATVNMPWPEVELSNGDKATIDQSGYGALRYLPNRDDRLKVFQAFWTRMNEYKETFAGLLATKVNTDHFYALAGNYDNDLQSALDRTDVPTDIYHNMIKQVRAGLPVLHRYLKLRQKILGVEKLGYHDMYTSIVASVDWKFDYDSGFDTILAAMEVMGSDYVKVLKGARDQRWTDVYPTGGKRTGAYMSGEAYDVHPYVLLNYTDDYSSMSTAAHEFGHALHSYLANKHQAFPNAGYPIFVAEVASTVDEILLGLYMSKKETDKARRIYLLGQALETYRTTVFRQALFAEFELLIHQMAQDGKPLTADALNETYLKLLREYYGEEQGLTEIDPLYAAEWAYIPHFYYNFYMFQYTTSYIAATSIAQTIFDGDTKARDAYLEMLKAGGSRSPVELLNMAGVDMSGPGPYEKSFKAMDRILDEIEELLK